MGYLVLIAGLLLALIFMVQGSRAPSPREMAVFLRWGAGVGLLVLAAILLFAGRFGISAALAGAGWLLCRGDMSFLRGILGAPSGGQEGDAEGASGPGGNEQRRQEGNPGRSYTNMTEDEAWQVLGLEPGCNAEAIRMAHRELMQKVHPDKGGSSYLAAKLNQAKDLLLSRVGD